MNDQRSGQKKIHRFIGDFENAAGRIVIRDTALIHQIRRVLKLRVGESLALVSGGQEHLARLERLDDDGVVAVVLETAAADREPAARVSLYCAIVKKENFELIVQKATEIGVAAIIPVISRRTVKLNVRMDRLQAIAREAAEQSGRSTVPRLAEPLELAAALRLAGSHDQNWFFDPTGTMLAAPELAAASGHSLGLFVGPEGGWDAAELAEARQAGCRLAGLGRLVFRAETAAIAAAYLACWPPATRSEVGN